MPLLSVNSILFALLSRIHNTFVINKRKTTLKLGEEPEAIEFIALGTDGYRYAWYKQN